MTNIASVFDWFARDSVHAAEENDDPGQRETLLKLALQWEAARNGAAPNHRYNKATRTTRRIVSVPLQGAR